MSNHVYRSPILQACAVPYRAGEGAVEFCLVTSIGKGRWGFPKGIIEAGDTELETAAKEAWEEAGLVGDLVGEALGQYWYEKWDTRLLVTCFLMQVREAHDEWEESRLRRRRFTSLEQARQLLANADQRRMLDVASSRLEGHCRRSIAG